MLMPENTNLQGLLDGLDGGLAILSLLLGRFNLLGSRLLLLLVSLRLGVTLGLRSHFCNWSHLE